MTTKNVGWKEKLWQVPGINQQISIFFLHSLLLHIGLLGIADVLLNFYLISIGYDTETISTLQALPRLSGFLTGLPIGMLANRIGKRRIIILSSYGVAFCTAAVVLAPSLWLIGISRFFWGFFFGAGQIVKPPYMVTLIHRNEHTAQFAYHNLISMLSVSVGSMIGGFLPIIVSTIFSLSALDSVPPEQTPAAYQGAILLAAGLIALSAMPLYRLPTDELSITNKHKRKNPLDSRTWIRIIKLSLPLLIFGISGGLTFPFFNLFFREHHDLADKVVGTIIALGWLAMALVPLLNPTWERQVGRVRALTGLMTVSAAAFFGLGVASNIFLAVPMYMLAIGIRNAMQPLYQPILMDSLPSELHNLASSVGLVLWNIGWFSATLSFGWLQLHIGLGGIMFVVAVFVVLNGFSILAVFSK